MSAADILAAELRAFARQYANTQSQEVLFARALAMLVEAPPALSRAVRALGLDWHDRSTRPCSTCSAVSAALGEPFGCDAYRIERAADAARRAQAAKPSRGEP